jgi:hypothetical protein
MASAGARMSLASNFSPVGTFGRSAGGDAAARRQGGERVPGGFDRTVRLAVRGLAILHVALRCVHTRARARNPGDSFGKPALNFYRVKNGYGWMEKVEPIQTAGASDFYLLLPADRGELNSRRLSAIETDTGSAATLAAPGR